MAVARAVALALIVASAAPASAQPLAGGGSTLVTAAPRLGLRDVTFWTGSAQLAGSEVDAALALAEREGLGPHRVVSTRGGLVELLRTHRGLDVVGSELALRFDRRGALRWVSAHAVEVPSTLSVTPMISGAQALAAAGAVGLAPGRHTRLVIFAAGAGTPRLAWHVRYADELRGQTYRVYVDARDSRVLSAETLTRRAPEHRARVWDVSPVDGEIEEVTLHGLPAGASELVDDDFEVLGCVDRARCHEVRTTSGIRRVHHCDLEPTVFAGADGAFLHVTPPEDHADPTDGFAEVQLYHHLSSGLAAFRAWADDPAFALTSPLTAIANGRVPDLSSGVAYCEDDVEEAPSGSRLLIEENAYFWPAGEIGPTGVGDRIVMHQTERTDWAYDGEIVWHELTHAVMHTLTPLAWRTRDERGSSYEGGGLHEGFSDYFAASLSGRPTLAWYGGTADAGPAPLNDLEAPSDCRDVMTGEEHDESAPWAGALWSIRRLLRSRAKRDMFDRALFVAVDALGQRDGFARAEQLVLAELELGAEALIEDQGLDADGAAYLWEQVASAESRFTERGLPGCDGRTQTLGLGEEKESLQLVGPIVWGIDEHRGEPIPASVQMLVEVPEGAQGLRLRLAEGEAYDSTRRDGTDLPTAPELGLLVRAGAAITWDGSGHDADRAVEVRLDADGGGECTVLDLSPGAHFLQLTNAGADWIAYGLSVEAITDDDRPADGFGPPTEMGSGCSVVRSSSPMTFTGLALGGLLFVTRLRRRRARQSEAA